MSSREWQPLITLFRRAGYPDLLGLHIRPARRLRQDNRSGTAGSQCSPGNRMMIIILLNNVVFALQNCAFGLRIARCGATLSDCDVYWTHRGLQRDVVYLGWPMAPSYMSPNAGGRGGGVAGSQPVSTAVHRSPNKLWRYNSISTTVYLGGEPRQGVHGGDGCRPLPRWRGKRWLG
jgi:hypothetical protein